MLNQTSEYALRAVCALARRQGVLVPTSELADITGLPFPYLAKVLQQLASADVITGRRGVGGGYRLVQDPSEITMLDVVRAIGGDRQARGATKVAENPAGFEELMSAMERANLAARSVFGSVTINEVAMKIETAESERASSNGAVSATANGSSNGAFVGSQNGIA